MLRYKFEVQSICDKCGHTGMILSCMKLLKNYKTVLMRKQIKRFVSVQSVVMRNNFINAVSCFLLT